MQDDAKQAAKATRLMESLTVEVPGFVSIVSVVELGCRSQSTPAVHEPSTPGAAPQAMLREADVLECVASRPRKSRPLRCRSAPIRRAGRGLEGPRTRVGEQQGVVFGALRGKAGVSARFRVAARAAGCSVPVNVNASKPAPAKAAAGMVSTPAKEARDECESQRACVTTMLVESTPASRSPRRMVARTGPEVRHHSKGIRTLRAGASRSAGRTRRRRPKALIRARWTTGPLGKRARRTSLRSARSDARSWPRWFRRSAPP